VPAAHRDFHAYDATPGVAMDSRTIGAAGGNQPHENMPPYLGISFIISLFGIFPSPT
jgi:microcystin-dependent protein